jgi:murein DD-endopeptidase MepM/ murein hydrolase activator NlpD
MSPAEALLTAVFFMKGANPGVGPKIIPPVVNARITSEYGTRADPLHGKKRFHDGIDFAAPAGSPVRAVAAGHVIFCGTTPGFGRVVGVRHNKDVTTLYAHCWASRVSVGDSVSAGTILGFVGESGRATGPHLHFEVRVDGKSVNPVAILSSKKP